MEVDLDQIGSVWGLGSCFAARFLAIRPAGDAFLGLLYSAEALYGRHGRRVGSVPRSKTVLNWRRPLRPAAAATSLLLSDSASTSLLLGGLFISLPICELGGDLDVPFDD